MEELISTLTKEGKHPTIFGSITASGHERVVHYYDKFTGLKAIVAIHSTVLGPSLGGARMWNYTSEEEALVDVLRLSKGMTYKSAITGLDLGGGKAVIIGDAKKIKTEALLRSYGRFIETLKGIYITAADVNTDMRDMEYISKETQYVVGLPTLQGGSGDPSLVTAYGTYLGIKAATKKVYGNDSLCGKKVGVEGVGKVGASLVGHLCKEGAEVYAADISQKNLAEVTKKHPVKVVQPGEIYDLAIDIYAPCALGATINDGTIERLNCQIIGGAANNQLEDEIRHSSMLRERNIVYIPDFLISAGGVINVYTELWGEYSKELAYQRTEDIYKISLEVLKIAEEEYISTHEAAKKLAEQRIDSIQNAHLS
ncbi:MAG: leucine dehydrogenase [Cytophagales bacterium]|nr:leucine dehydrogenase [Cytophagales bacterium]